MIPQKNKKYAICGYPQGVGAPKTLFKGVAVSDGVLGNSDGYYFWFSVPGEMTSHLYKKEDIIAEIPDIPEMKDCFIDGADLTNNTLTVKLQFPDSVRGAILGKKIQISF